MAIIQSILVGKGKGKIGNVVLSGLKGQTVAKQLNSSPSNPRTVAQTANRVKMANAVLAWQFLAMFFSYAKGIRKPLESVYNAFVREVVKAMPEQLLASRSLAASDALRLNLFSGNWFTVVNTTVDAAELVATFNPSGVDWASSYRVVFLYFDNATGIQKVVERALTEAEFNAGEISHVTTDLAGVVMNSLYIYDSATSKITNVASVEI